MPPQETPLGPPPRRRQSEVGGDAGTAGDEDAAGAQTPIVRRADLPEDRHRALGERCQALFDRLALRDYGRFDFRTAADGTLKLLEAKPNPAWGYDAKMALMAGFAGWSYAELMEKLVLTAWARITRAAGAR